MRMSRLFGRTLRQVPRDVSPAGHALLVRAGFIRQVAAGIFSELPLGRRATARIEGVLRRAMDGLGGQEIKMPVVLPADLWRETGRWSTVGPELGRLQDRGQRDLVLAMTHEEAVGHLTRSEVLSHRDLPALVYHLQTKWRDDPRPRGGLLRVREFTMLDSYSLDADDEGLDAQYAAHLEAYHRIFARLGLPVVAVEADTGMMEGRESHEFMYLSPVGEDTVLMCEACQYKANRQVARVGRPEAAPSPLGPMERVATPGATTIDALARYLGIEAASTAKALFFTAAAAGPAQATDALVLAVVRGDMEASETKVARAAGARGLRPATDDEITARGAVPGYGSPVGLPPAPDLVVVVDEAVAAAAGLVAGANAEGFHLRNARYGRDYQASVVADIVAAADGDPCPACGGALGSERAVEVGNTFKLGTFYSDAMGCTFLDTQGNRQPVVMGSYGIGVGRTLACLAEEHRDDAGLAWPISVAPFDVHVLSLPGAEVEAEAVYGTLVDAGIEALFDDRDERPGVKFADADLIGIPIRVAVGGRSVAAGGAEVRLRRQADAEVVALEEVDQAVAALASALRVALDEAP